MRIISDFTDYYDSLQSYNKDDDIVYFRKNNEIKYLNKKSPLDINKYPHFNRIWPFSQINQIGFCGKIYFFYCGYINIREGLDKTLYDGVEYLYNRESMIKFVDKFYPKFSQHFNKKYSRPIEWKDYNKWPQRYNKYSHISKFPFKEELEIKYPEYIKRFTPLFIKYKTPIWYDNGIDNIIINPNLRQFQFYKVFGTQKAFQELEMYVGNTAKPIKPIPKIDDITMRDIKGFDKFSFKKDKGTNKV